jgi:hypothetical protein
LKWKQMNSYWTLCNLLLPWSDSITFCIFTFLWQCTHANAAIFVL